MALLPHQQAWVTQQLVLTKLITQKPEGTMPSTSMLVSQRLLGFRLPTLKAHPSSASFVPPSSVGWPRSTSSVRSFWPPSMIGRTREDWRRDVLSKHVPSNPSCWSGVKRVWAGATQNQEWDSKLAQKKRRKHKKHTKTNLNKHVFFCKPRIMSSALRAWKRAGSNPS